MRTIPCHECGLRIPAHLASIRSALFQQVAFHPDCLEQLAEREEADSPAALADVSGAA